MRKWTLAALAALAVCLAGLAYHGFVTRRSAEHFRGLVQAPTAAEKASHYREVFRFYDPLDPWRLRARQVVAANGRNWGLQEDGEVRFATDCWRFF
jgi:hypothetical protein